MRPSFFSFSFCLAGLNTIFLAGFTICAWEKRPTNFAQSTRMNINTYTWIFMQKYDSIMYLKKNNLNVLVSLYELNSQFLNNLAV